MIENWLLTTAIKREVHFGYGDDYRDLTSTRGAIGPRVYTEKHGFIVTLHKLYCSVLTAVWRRLT